MAQSELIVIVFDHLEDAFWARRSLASMRAQHMFGLEYAAEITRDNAGQTVLHHHMALPAYPHPVHIRMPSLLSNAIFSLGTTGKHLKLAAAGLDEFFVEAVTQAMVPNRSALLIFVPYAEQRIDLPTLLQVIVLFKGTLHRTSVPWELEEFLLSHG
jgi:uncharacterized membrane protein